MKIDFHVHTKYSVDSIIEPRELVKKALRLSIIPAIADHNTISAHREMKQLTSSFIPAEEVQTDIGDLIFLYSGDLIRKGTGFAEALDLIHEQGGLAYLPHMYDRTRHGAVPKNGEIRKIDIVEVFNPRCLDPVYNSRARIFAEKNNLFPAAGSDSHFLFEFGKTYTEMPDFDLDSPKELLASLKKAKLVTSAAPFYARGTTTLVKLGKNLTKHI
jgi:predicted metal-dependent phosphoesterase TrpH